MAMELKSSITILSLLFLLIVAPSRGRSDVSILNSDIYEIDYRGPETHSYIPPPKGAGGGRLRPHQESGGMAMAHPRSKGIRGGHFGGNGKK